ncbi:hypothetical protein GCM10011390_33470 [Aureimonas endophytica]|uniref:HPt domain-containing protein n=1 Tax=Aureimonas endophytica TaxID=2027858 RepID=A0A916ZSB6_9HYPH|nr:Hpt domain-containing protein [Aureimonas endophytica]GGE11652.1 hypothetical protein GCM10011390_33470 [Aureimonas endophytica]
MDAMAEIRQTFFEECAEGLRELDASLLAIGGGDRSLDTANVAFRAVHSIKGGGGAFHFDDLVHFAHLFEAMLDEIRNERLEPSAPVLDLAQRSARQLADLVAAARDRDRMMGLVEELKAYSGEKGAAIARFWSGGSAPEGDDGMEGLEFVPVEIDLSDVFGALPETTYRITFRPQPELYQKANEAARLIRDCLALGTGSVRCDTGDLPPLAEIEPEGAYFTWTIELTTRSSEADIRAVFEFAEWDCELAVEAMPEETGEGAPSLDAAFASLLMQIQSEPGAEFVPDEEEPAVEPA